MEHKGLLSQNGNCLAKKKNCVAVPRLCVKGGGTCTFPNYGYDCLLEKPK